MTALTPAPGAPRLPEFIMIYLAQNVDVVIVVFVFVLVLIVKDHFFFSLVDSGLEDLIRPGVLFSPVVFLVLVLEVVAPYVRIPV